MAKKNAPVGARAKGYDETAKFHPYYNRKLPPLQEPDYVPDARFWCDVCQLKAAMFESLAEYWRTVAILDEAGIQ